MCICICFIYVYSHSFEEPEEKCHIFFAKGLGKIDLRVELNLKHFLLSDLVVALRMMMFGLSASTSYLENLVSERNNKKKELRGLFLRTGVGKYTNVFMVANETFKRKMEFPLKLTN